MKTLIIFLLASYSLNLAFPTTPCSDAAATDAGCAGCGKNTADNDQCFACIGASGEADAADSGCNTQGTGVDSNCYAYGPAGTCLACKPGFYATTTTCTACPTGVQHCAANDNATAAQYVVPYKCLDGFTWVNSSADTASSTCAACAANATTAVCKNCDTNNTTTTCDVIMTGVSKFIAPSTFIITDCPTGCTDCTSATNCTSCTVDYYLPAGTGDKLCQAKGSNAIISSILSLIALSLFARF